MHRIILYQYLCVYFEDVSVINTLLALECPNSQSKARGVFGNVGTPVQLNCGDIGSDTSIIWINEESSIMIGHSIGSEPVYPDEDSFPRTKYVYNKVDHSLTVTDVSLKDEVCYRCRTLPSGTYTTSLITILGEL